MPVKKSDKPNSVPIGIRIPLELYIYLKNRAEKEHRTISGLILAILFEEKEKDTRIQYDPKFGDNRKCKCGHSYVRHFDPYENWEFVGCKYCGCNNFILDEENDSE